MEQPERDLKRMLLRVNRDQPKFASMVLREECRAYIPTVVFVDENNQQQEIRREVVTSHGCVLSS